MITSIILPNYHHTMYGWSSFLKLQQHYTITLDSLNKTPVSVIIYYYPHLYHYYYLKIYQDIVIKYLTSIYYEGGRHSHHIRLSHQYLDLKSRNFVGPNAGSIFSRSPAPDDGIYWGAYASLHSFSVELSVKEQVGRPERLVETWETSRPERLVEASRDQGD